MKIFYIRKNLAFMLRKGIGEENVDYSQIIRLPSIIDKFTDEEMEPFINIKPAGLIYTQDFETPYLPIGFTLKINLISNWGDTKLIGMNKIFFYDQCGREIENSKISRILQIPENKLLENNSISNLNTTPDILISENQKNNFSQDKNFWVTDFIDISKYEGENKLQPYMSTFSNFNMNEKKILNPQLNTLYFIFEKPVALSFIEIYNISEQPERGVKEIQILFEENIIFKGIIKKFCEKTNKTTILFSSDNKITKLIDLKSLNKINMKNIYLYKHELKKISAVDEGENIIVENSQVGKKFNFYFNY